MRLLFFKLVEGMTLGYPRNVMVFGSKVKVTGPICAFFTLLSAA